MASNLPFLAVKDFAKHQHYRDRRPPWIKFYGAVLTDPAILQLPEAAQAQLFKLWLLASQMGNPLPNNPKLLAGKIGTPGRFYLPELIASGLIVPCEQNACSPLAEVEESASTPVRVAQEEERELEREQATTSSSARSDVERLLAGLLDETVRMSWKAEIVASRAGMHGPPLTDEQINRACRDYVGNGHLAQPSLRHFRGFLRDAAKPAKRPEAVGDALDTWAQQPETRTKRPA